MSLGRKDNSNFSGKKKFNTNNYQHINKFILFKRERTHGNITSLKKNVCLLPISGFIFNMHLKKKRRKKLTYKTKILHLTYKITFHTSGPPTF